MTVASIYCFLHTKHLEFLLQKFEHLSSNMIFTACAVSRSELKPDHWGSSTRDAVYLWLEILCLETFWHSPRLKENMLLLSPQGMLQAFVVAVFVPCWCCPLLNSFIFSQHYVFLFIPFSTSRWPLQSYSPPFPRFCLFSPIFSF